MANKLVIEIRHAAAAKAATGGNTRSVEAAPEAPPDTKKAVPTPSTKPGVRTTPPMGTKEPKPPYAQENVGDTAWQAAEKAAMLKMHTQLKGK